MRRCPASLPTLPEEMIDVIISFTDHETQQQLRLCCRQFNRLTTPRYFRNFRFRLSQLSLDGLISIASHQAVAKYVQDLEFNSHQLLWFFNFDHFLRELHLQPGQPWRPPPGLKHIPTQDFTRPQLHQIYTAYTSERDTPADYIDCVLARADPSNPLLPHTYPSLPRALASLPNLHTITATFGMEHQQHPPAYAHTWRGLAFAKPDPDPPGDRDNQKAVDSSCLLHALGHAATALRKPLPLPLRTLNLPIIGPGIFGPIALHRLWNIDGPYRSRSSTANANADIIHIPPAALAAPPVNINNNNPPATITFFDAAADDALRYDESVYGAHFRTLVAAVAGLTRLDLHLNWCGGGRPRGPMAGLAAFLGSARGLEELALVVESGWGAGVTGTWRTRLAPDPELCRKRDPLLALLGREGGGEGDGESGGEGEGEEEGEGDGERDVEVVGVRWPRLRKLTLEATTTQDGLLGLLGRVAGSLRSLTLCNVRFMPRMGEWGGALREVREMLELDRLELSWLVHELTGYYAILAPRDVGILGVDEDGAQRRYRMTYRHYETQVVDYVLKKSHSKPELDQGRFFKEHPEYCDWCEGNSLENDGNDTKVT
ncbi:hypothetical protein SLS58_001432 [Diplodia intermedia]|uniref:F-box domain-containing protein n=1 Tax=Diplodia intermedia TaxID=856260 RepID=A0ABR3U307_9PEZI